MIVLILNVLQDIDDLKTSFIPFLSFAGLVAIAWSLNPIPSRTRPLNSTAPMVLRLKTRESRSLPGLQRTGNREKPSSRYTHKNPRCPKSTGGFCVPDPPKTPRRDGGRAVRYDRVMTESGVPVAPVSQAHPEAGALPQERARALAAGRRPRDGPAKRGQRGRRSRS